METITAEVEKQVLATLKGHGSQLLRAIENGYGREVVDAKVKAFDAKMRAKYGASEYDALVADLMECE